MKTSVDDTLNDQSLFDLMKSGTGYEKQQATWILYQRGNEKVLPYLVKIFLSNFNCSLKYASRLKDVQWLCNKLRTINFEEQIEFIIDKKKKISKKYWEQIVKLKAIRETSPLIKKIIDFNAIAQKSLDDFDYSDGKEFNLIVTDVYRDFTDSSHIAFIKSSPIYQRLKIYAPFTYETILYELEELMNWKYEFKEAVPIAHTFEDGAYEIINVSKKYLIDLLRYINKKKVRKILEELVEDEDELVSNLAWKVLSTLDSKPPSKAEESNRANKKEILRFKDLLEKLENSVEEKKLEILQIIHRRIFEEVHGKRGIANVFREASGMILSFTKCLESGNPDINKLAVEIAEIVGNELEWFEHSYEEFYKSIYDWIDYFELSSYPRGKTYSKEIKVKAAEIIRKEIIGFNRYRNYAFNRLKSLSDRYQFYIWDFDCSYPGLLDMLTSVLMTEYEEEVISIIISIFQHLNEPVDLESIEENRQKREKLGKERLEKEKLEREKLEKEELERLALEKEATKVAKKKKAKKNRNDIANEERQKKLEDYWK